MLAQPRHHSDIITWDLSWKIYPGDITLARQVEVDTENYDPGLASHVVILISSQERETLSKAAEYTTTHEARRHAPAGIPLVIVCSFGDIFKRNATNNGQLCGKYPVQVADLTATYAKDGTRGAGGGELTMNIDLAMRLGMEVGRVGRGGSKG
ncbi:hypothetical protein GALMADRAFT_154826 [Galerina marginata CBS 339.88]|uniref:Aconitase A/isopropylmalate dehydratase small subunit swivel domain-containing protein n=1 Tax=Galerina marginata (strain CBS 339.88) TaxID=685588 RepID=A0A067TJ36_GALM3|nr:hypothetical protein GALMADRAFT_154826 [Galerina marginata CBS 339.88]